MRVQLENFLGWNSCEEDDKNFALFLLVLLTLIKFFIMITAMYFLTFALVLFIGGIDLFNLDLYNLI